MKETELPKVTASAATSRAPRLVQAPAKSKLLQTIGLDIGNGLLAALQSAAITVAILIIPTVLSVLITNLQLADSNDSWLSSSKVALQFWALGHGFSGDIAGLNLSLIPLGISLIATLVGFSTGKRSLRLSVASAISSYLGYLTLLAFASYWLFGSLAELPRGVLLTSLVYLLGLFSGSIKSKRAGLALTITRSVKKVPLWLTEAVKLSLAVACILIIISVIVVLSWLFNTRDATGAIIQQLNPDGVGGLSMIIAQLVYVPTLLIWACAYSTGLGFQIAAGSSYASTGSIPGVIPGLPIFATIPLDHWPVWLVTCFHLLLCLLGVFVGVTLTRKLTTELWWKPYLSALVFLTVLTTIVLLALFFSTGQLGKQALAEVGPDYLAVSLHLLLYISIGVLAALLLSQGTRSLLAAKLQHLTDSDGKWEDISAESAPSSDSRANESGKKLEGSVDLAVDDADREEEAASPSEGKRE